MGARDTLREFASYTSIHGLGRVQGSTFIIQRLFWILATITSFSFCVFQVYRLGDQYFKGAVTTLLTMSHYPQRFPYVKFCNMNPFKYSEVIKQDTLLLVLQETSSNLKINLSEFDTSVQPQARSSAGQDSNIHDNTKNLVDARKMFALQVSKMNNTNREQMAHSFDEMVISCKFDGNRCNQSDVEMVDDNENGICFVFSSKAYANIAGYDQGLELIFNVNQSEYIPFVVSSVGMYVAVYNSHPGTLEQIPVGFETNIGISRKINIRQPGVTGNCDQSNEYASASLCMSTCLAELILEACFCIFDLNSLRNADKKENPYPLCSSNENNICIGQQSKRDLNSICSHCKPPCEEDTFEQSISMNMWPTASVTPVVEKLVQDTTTALNKDAYRENLLMLKVYYSTLAVETIREEPAYTEENYISDIGGQIGLWIGMSVLSLAEVLELLGLLCLPFCRKHTTTDSSKKEAFSTQIN